MSKFFTHRIAVFAARQRLKTAANLHDWAKRELELAGLFDEDSDYAGALGPQILALVKVFSEQGHSGFSAGMVRSVLNKLLNFEPLTPVKDPIKEKCYTDISDFYSDGKTHYQCTRDFTIFSDDGGKTWYKMVSDVYDDGDGVSYAKYRNVPLQDYNNGKGHSVDYRVMTAN